MFIYWGTKERVKHFGNCARFCDFCNDLQVMKVSELHTVSHLYAIPLGKYKYKHTEVSCNNCKNSLITLNQASNYYCSNSSDLKTLCEKVPQDLKQEWNFKINEIQKIKENLTDLNKEDRFSILYENFIKFENQLRLKIQKGPEVNANILPGCLSYILLILFIIFLGKEYNDSQLNKYFTRESGIDSFGQGMLLFLFIGICQVIWLFGTHKSKYFKKQIYPYLAKNIFYLKPNLQDFIQIKQKLKSNKYEMACFSISKLEMALSDYSLQQK